MNQKLYKSSFARSRFLSALLIVTFVGACADQSDVAAPSFNEFTEVAIPDAYRSHLIQNGRFSSDEVEIHEVDVKITREDGTEVIGKMRFTMPASGEETLVAFEMTSDLFDGTGLSPDFWISNPGIDGALDGRIASSCIASCQKEFTDKDGNKIKGRGVCKANCWLETAAKVAAVFVAIAAL